MTKELRKRIRKDKYIKFEKLLPVDDDNVDPDEEDKTTLVVENGRVKQARNRPKKIPMTYARWCRAFEIFSAIYMAEKASTVKEAIAMNKQLLAYKRWVATMKMREFDWLAYDRTYRQQRSRNPVPFDVVNMALYAAYGASAKRSQPGSFNANQERRGAFPSVERRTRVPFGYCFVYHTSGEGQCASERICGFKHSCWRCQGRHPGSRPCRPVPRQQGQNRRRDKPNDEPNSRGNRPANLPRVREPPKKRQN